MATPQDLIAEIKARISLVDLAQEAGVTLRQQGGEWAGLCLFHSDKDPSFRVYDDGQRWICHAGCGGGDQIDLWAKHRGISLQEARDELAARLGLGQASSPPPPRPRRPRRQPEPALPPAEVPAPGPLEAVSVMEGMVARAEEALAGRLDVLTYLQEQRHLTPDIIHRARLGYDGKQDRVVIPLTDRQGQVVRTRLYDWAHRQPGLKVTWGGGSSKKPRLYPAWALDQPALLVVEGEMDALAAWSLGVPAITCTGGAGKTWTREMVAEFAGKVVTICYDVDPEGQQSARRVAARLARVAAGIKILTLPLDWRQKSDPKDLTDWIHAGGTHEQLLHLMEQAESVAADETAGEDLPVCEALPDAPVPETHLIPRGWRLRPDGLFEVKAAGDGELKLHRILPLPVLVTGRLRNLDTGEERLELAYARDGHWRTVTVERALAADKNKIVQLANRGLLVTSNNSRAVVQYLADYESANLEEIPEQMAVSSCGPRRIGDEHVFVLGNRVISAGDEPPEVSLVPESDGDTQAVEALRSKGDLEVWMGLVRKVIPFPRVMLALYSSFVPPLQHILGVNNFFLDFCGDTSLGKTTTIELAASVWGFPFRDHGGLIKAWANTRVFLERYPALFNGLPIFLDESQAVSDPKLVANAVYSIANGVGKGRGSVRGGTQRTVYWQTVCFSTGEQPVTANTEFGGARTRAVTSWNSPFGGPDQGPLVEEIKATLAEHHGLAGPIFIRELLESESRWFDIRELHRQRHKALSEVGVSKQSRAIAHRLAGYLAAIWVAGDLVNMVLKLDYDVDGLAHQTLAQLVSQFDGQDYATRAMELVHSWVYGQIHKMDGREHPMQEAQSDYIGVWREEEYGDKFVALYPHKLRPFLEQSGFSYETILKHWRDRNWIECHDGLTRPVMTRHGRPRMVKIPMAVWKSEDGQV